MSKLGLEIKLNGSLSDISRDMESAIDIWLEESAGELEAKVKTLSRVDTGQTKGSYEHVVDDSKKEAIVGSPLQNAIWEEYGTGQYALNGNGRQGWWVYVKGSDGTYKSDSPRKYYTKQQAAAIMMSLRSKGLDAHMTCGKTPNRPIERAFSESETKIIKRLEYVLKDIGGNDES